MTTLQQEQKDTYLKMLEINSLFESFGELDNKDYRGWIKRLDALKTGLCESVYWEELMCKIETLKSKIS